MPLIHPTHRRNGIIFMMHCQSNTGFAIENLEKVFFAAAVSAGYAEGEVYFSYPSLEKGKPRWMAESFNNWMLYDYTRNTSRVDLFRAIEDRNIRTAFIFDLQPDNLVNKVLRQAGVRRIIAYWGAPISSLNSGVKLLVKRLEMELRRAAPDLYIFESQAMKEMAVDGRGIRTDKCVVIPTGVDTTRFCRKYRDSNELFRTWGIDAASKVFVYAGHMEERKGVHVIVRAIDHIVGEIGRRDIHFLAFGNRPGEEQRFFDMLQHKRTRERITFAGYHDMIEQAFAGAYAGIVASTGWDSWPMSVIEMAASELPLIVSDLQGLKEFVKNGVNGWRFPPGDVSAAASLMLRLADDPALAARMGKENREKVLQHYSRDLQIKRLGSALSLNFS